MQKIGFIGAGNMAYAIISGLINTGYSKDCIKISDTNSTLLSQRKVEFGLEIFKHNVDLVNACDILIFAVKPQALPQICKEFCGHLNNQLLFISIVAGIKTFDIERWMGGDEHAIVRAMPNTPALFNQSITGVFANKHTSTEQKTQADNILKSVGNSVWVSDETLLDVVTAVSGSGPAYFFLMLESMTKTGIDLGLDETTAQTLSIQTALGSAIMADKSSDSLNALRAKVTSPNGTTQAAIESFQSQDFELIVAHAIKAAFNRAEQIGKQFSDEP